MSDHRNRFIPLFAMMVGIGLVGFGANEAYRAYRYDRAASELREIFAGATLSQGAQPPARTSRFEILDKFEAPVDKEAGARDEVPADEIPRLRLTTSDLLPTDKFVRPLGAETSAEGPEPAGTQSDPWIGLQAALDRLMPGDRLIVMSGQYGDTYRIGSQAQNGTPERPITVYFASDALLLGADPGFCEAESLMLEVSFWVFEGLNISPQGCSAGVRVGARVRSAAFNSLHISGAAKDGVVIDAGAEGVVLKDAHLHQIGTLEGKGRDTRGTHRVPEESQYAAVKAQVGSIALSGGKVHNIFGLPFVLTAGDGSTVTGEPLMTLVDRWGVSVNVGQEKWW